MDSEDNIECVQVLVPFPANATYTEMLQFLLHIVPGDEFCYRILVNLYNLSQITPLEGMLKDMADYFIEAWGVPVEISDPPAPSYDGKNIIDFVAARERLGR